MATQRQERVLAAFGLESAGWTRRQIAEHFGVSYSMCNQWFYDPDLSKQRARRRGYQRCIECGCPTDGSNGRAKAPERCRSCRKAHRAPDHGSLSRYRGGCRCADCREANRVAMAELKGRTPPSHGYSGYQNYGCRCDICKAGHSDRLASRKLQSRAYKAVATAIARGDLVRPATCSECACGPTQAHHEDYARPLDVVWLCSACHGARHRQS